MTPARASAWTSSVSPRIAAEAADGVDSAPPPDANAGSRAPIPPNRASEGKLWWGTLAGLTLLSLWPIWAARFPAMLDYPQHLLLAAILNDLRDPASDFSRYFQYDIEITYLTFYAFVWMATWVVPIEIAGKLFLTAYILVIAFLADSVRRQAPEPRYPWGALVLFPFAFNQHYYLGFTNYMLSIPLLLFALLDHANFAHAPADARRVLRHLTWIALLFVTHPLTFMAYCALAGFQSLFCFRRPRVMMRSLSFPVAAGVAMIGYLVATGSLASGSTLTVSTWQWKDLSWTLVYFSYMFTGMSWYEGVDAAACATWAALGLVIVGAWRRHGWARAPELAREASLLGLALAAVLLFPHEGEHGAYGFLNVRFSAIFYFLLAVIVSHVRVVGRWRYALIALVAFSLIQSGARQLRVSDEIADIERIVDQMPRGARVLPLHFQHSASEIGLPILLHVNDYYHILSSSGVNPYIIPARHLPVAYKEGLRLPSPGVTSPFFYNWPEYGFAYDYIILNGATTGVPRMDDPNFALVAQSGIWRLYRSLEPPRPSGEAPVDRSPSSR
jgi:hypothetical protein